MAARNAEIVYKPCYEGKGRHKDFYRGKWPHKAFYEGKCSYKDFYKGNWPRAARKCFEIVVHQSVVETAVEAILKPLKIVVH